MIIFAACALFTLAVLVYVFWVPGQFEVSEDKTRLAYLHERRDVAYENLRDVNFEYQAGKLPEADYHKLKALITENASAILAKIVRLETVGASTGRK